MRKKKKNKSAAVASPSMGSAMTPRPANRPGRAKKSWPEMKATARRTRLPLKIRSRLAISN